MTFIDYIQLFNDAVRYYTDTNLKKWQVPQTFALLNTITDLQAPNLGKYVCDKNKPFFYSRKWEAFQYNPSKLGYDTPAVIMFENAGDYKKAFTRQAETTYTFDLFVMDRFSADDCKKTNCQEGVSRSIYEIYHDTEQILYNILEYVHDLVVVKYIPEGTTFLHNRARYNFMIDIGYWRPDLWVIDETATTKILKDLRENNAVRAFHRVEPYINADWFGTKITVRFTVPNCRTIAYDFHKLIEIPDTWDKNCC